MRKMKYSLEITQSAEGEQSVVSVEAEGVLTDGVLTLAYSFDGDAYSLEISKLGMRHERKGNLNLLMSFRMGEATDCRISDGVRGGCFSVFTEEYQADFDGLNYTVNCLFSDGQGGAPTRIKAMARRLE